jgi:drug/metabolite transporter (DMT)-like permease
MSRVVTLGIAVGFIGMILVVIQDPFRNHSAPHAIELELALVSVCRIFGALIAIVATTELLLRLSSDQEIPKITHWVVVLLAALCLFTPTWSAPAGLAIVAVVLIVAPRFGRSAKSAEKSITSEEAPPESSSDFNDWQEP